MAFRCAVALAVVRFAGRSTKACPVASLGGRVPTMAVRLASTSSDSSTGGGSGGVVFSASRLHGEGQTILDHLLKTEVDAEALYKEMSAKAKNEGFRTIFAMLAREEAKHTEWIQLLLRDGKLGPAVALNKSLLGDIQKIGLTMKEAKADLNKLCSDQVELYRLALGIEAQSRDFYAERAKVVADPALRKLLEIIAAEEDRHYLLMKGLLEFLTDDVEEGHEMEQPNFWVRLSEPISEMAKL